jgi:hypothetical protein
VRGGVLSRSGRSSGPIGAAISNRTPPQAVVYWADAGSRPVAAGRKKNFSFKRGS